MEIFKLLKLHSKCVGVFNWHLMPPFHWIPITLLMRIVVICFLSISSVTVLVFCCTKAQHLKEFSESFVVGSTHFVALIWYLFFIWKQKSLDRLFDDLQNRVNSSNFNVINLLIKR